VWDIWRREDLPALRAFLRAYSRFFPDSSTHSGHVELAPWEDPVTVQRFYLADRHRELLFALTGVQPWHVEQRVGEGVFIPAGCAHQVRRHAACHAARLHTTHAMPCTHTTQALRAAWERAAGREWIACAGSGSSPGTT
jgi:JmjC domain, hydroxylase